MKASLYFWYTNCFLAPSLGFGFAKAGDEDFDGRPWVAKTRAAASGYAQGQSRPSPMGRLMTPKAPGQCGAHLTRSATAVPLTGVLPSATSTPQYDRVSRFDFSRPE